MEKGEKLEEKEIFEVMRIYQRRRNIIIKRIGQKGEENLIQSKIFLFYFDAGVAQNL